MKHIKSIGFIAGLGLLSCLCFLFLSNQEVETPPQKPEVRSITISITPPEETELFGQKIDLTRYDMRERFDREINSFTYFHSTTIMFFKRANKYFPIIEPILKRNGIPDDFKYLATIESNLDIRSYSPAKAAGIWQLLAGTAQENGLEVNNQVDERYHIEKATQAACNYLKKANVRYGSWMNAAASYNAGMERISSELESQRVGSAFDLLLVEETSRYLFRIMAIKEIFSSPYKYGFLLKPENLYQPIPIEKVEITQDIPDLATFAQGYGINYFLLKEANPWLRDKKLKVLPGSKYTLDIPEKEHLNFDKNNIKIHNKEWITE